MIMATTYKIPYHEDGSDDPTDHVTITVSDQRPQSEADLLTTGRCAI